MESPDLQSLLDHFTARINTVWDLIPLVKLCNVKLNGHSNYPFSTYRVNRITNFSHFDANGEGCDTDDDSLPDLNAITDMIYEMKDMLCFIRENLQQQKTKLELQKERIVERNNHLRQHLCYIKENIPAFLTAKQVEESLPLNNVKITKPKGPTVETKPRNTENVKKVVKTRSLKGKIDEKATQKKKVNEISSKTEMKSVKRSHQEEVYMNWPTVSFVTTDEFESIPKYMRGRVTYEMINGAVTDFNQTIAEKYKLMSTHSSKYSEEELKKYQLYKSLESVDTTGQFFCLLHEFKELSAIKAENTIKIMLTCLRHCKRIKEIRGPSRMIRYAVVQ